MNTLKDIRLSLGLSQRQMAEKLGYSSQSVISQWESGARDIGLTEINKIINKFNINITDIVGHGDAYVKVPIIGKIAAGLPIEACQDELGTVLYHTKRNDLYGLIVCGESMNNFVKNNGIVICERFNHNLADINGKVVHAEKDGGNGENDATLKRYIHAANVLIPDSCQKDPETNKEFEAFNMADGWQIKGVVIKKLEDV